MCVTALVELRVTDDGTGDEGGDHIWDPDSLTRCADDACGFSGKLREFEIENQAALCTA